VFNLICLYEAPIARSTVDITPLRQANLPIIFVLGKLQTLLSYYFFSPDLVWKLVVMELILHSTIYLCFVSNNF
jgi:hypothetical protein